MPELSGVNRDIQTNLKQLFDFIRLIMTVTPLKTLNSNFSGIKKVVPQKH
jgi:hypothetical protein